jgi:hypothetical protein
MKTRIGFLKLAIVAAVAVAALAPATAQAQTNRGQLVQAVVRLNNAQLAFARKLADDAQFAAQFDQATASGNYDAAASLAASVTGIPKENIAVRASAGGGAGGAGGAGSDAFASATSTQSVYRLASLTRPDAPMQTTGKICFDFRVVAGCIAW